MISLMFMFVYKPNPIFITRNITHRNLISKLCFPTYPYVD
jgi:hypothetical protein